MGQSTPSGERRARRRESLATNRGTIYIFLLFSIVLIGLTITTAVPLWSTTVQREKEEELLFRLAEFRTAIARYRADHNRFPQKLEDLLVDTSQIQRKRYLRRIYPDPLTGKPDWKLDLVQDKAGTVSGIRDLHSTSIAQPIRTVGGKSGYNEW